jgi:hypothetical protein
MNKQKSSGSNRQSSPESALKQSDEKSKARSGKDAESHTKASSGKGAGGGAKQKRNH